MKVIIEDRKAIEALHRCLYYMSRTEELIRIKFLAESTWIRELLFSNTAYLDFKLNVSEKSEFDDTDTVLIFDAPMLYDLLVPKAKAKMIERMTFSMFKKEKEHPVLELKLKNNDNRFFFEKMIFPSIKFTIEKGVIPEATKLKYPFSARIKNKYLFYVKRQMGNYFNVSFDVEKSVLLFKDIRAFGEETGHEIRIPIEEIYQYNRDKKIDTYLTKSYFKEFLNLFSKKGESIIWIGHNIPIKMKEEILNEKEKGKIMGILEAWLAPRIMRDEDAR